MRKSLFLLLLFCSAFALPAHASSYSLKDSLYTVETDEESARESLDRISGHIDTGFASSDQSYISESHYGVGPFAKEQAEEHQQA